jgi:hypothetical protein
MRLTFPQVRRVGFSTINDESIIGPFESSSQVFNSAASKWGLLRRFNSLPLSESIGSFIKLPSSLDVPSRIFVMAK